MRKKKDIGIKNWLLHIAPQGETTSTEPQEITTSVAQKVDTTYKQDDSIKNLSGLFLNLLLPDPEMLKQWFDKFNKLFEEKNKPP